jgi:hypothetical protein
VGAWGPEYPTAAPVDDRGYVVAWLEEDERKARFVDPDGQPLGAPFPAVTGFGVFATQHVVADETGAFSITSTQGQHKRWRLHLGDSFTDVPRSSLYYRYVETVLHTGVSAGCGGNSFCPQSATSREQMSALLLLSEEGSTYKAAPCGAPVFADVPPSSPFCPFVEELARRGITGGCGGGNFCPGGAVTREQMSVFVLRTLDPALDPPACGTPVFGDVPPSSAFCRWIEELARRGIATGCGGGNFCPPAPVTREQMAVFLTTTFDLRLY